MNRWMAGASVAALVVCAASANAQRLEERSGPALFRTERAAWEIQKAKVDRARSLVPQSPDAKTPRASMGQDFVHFDVAADFDPTSGVVSKATATLTLAARGTAIDTTYLLVDQGLHVTDSTIDKGHQIFASEYPYAPYNYLILSFSPAIAPGEEVTFTVDYSGTLACAEYAPGYGSACAIGPNKFLYLNAGSLIPDVIDPDIGYSGDRMTRSMTLRVPSGLPIVASADKLSETDDGQIHETKWAITEGMPAWYSVILITGMVAEAPVDGALTPTELVFEDGSTQWNDDLLAWTPSVQSFLEDQAGAPLPYPALSGIKIPRAANWVGTVAYGMTLLADSYADLGLEGYEEIWAHENSHQWWATVVTPDDFVLERTLTEGLATFTQIDYTAARHHADEDRDLYLAHRYREADLYKRFKTPDLPPLLVASDKDVPTDFYGYEIWAYFVSSAMLDHLRATIGDAAFAQGLKNYASACAFKPCDLQSFREAMESAAATDLTPFYERFVYATKPVEVTVGFTQAPASSEVDARDVKVTLTQDEAKPLTVELWLELEDGTRQRERMSFDTLTATRSFTAAGPVRSVRLSPRHDVWIHSKSVQPGDLAFDGMVDGVDLLQCAHLEGLKALDETDQTSYFGVNLKFDPRCDTDGDGVISREDLNAVAEAIGIGSAP